MQVERPSAQQGHPTPNHCHITKRLSLIDVSLGGLLLCYEGLEPKSREKTLFYGQTGTNLYGLQTQKIMHSSLDSIWTHLEGQTFIRIPRMMQSHGDP